MDQLLGGQGSFLPIECSPSVESEAERISSQLLIRNSPEKIGHNEDRQTDIQEVDVNSIELLRPRSIGVENIALWAMEQVGFINLLTSLNLSRPQKAAITALIVGRMAKPNSERATHHWLCHTSGLGELLDVDFETMSLMQLYRANDLIWRNREEIENNLFSNIHGLFELDCSVTLYDLTNTFFEGDAKKNEKAKHERSKEKRSDCLLLSLGLVLDGSGFVRRSKVFSGNIGEATTLETMLRSLGAPNKALVVMDRGIASEENLDWLRNNNFRYIVMSRERNHQFDFNNSTCIKTASYEKINIQKVFSDDEKEVKLYCHSEARAKKEEGISQRFCRKFEEELQKLAPRCFRWVTGVRGLRR